MFKLLNASIGIMQSRTQVYHAYYNVPSSRFYLHICHWNYGDLYTNTVEKTLHDNYIFTDSKNLHPRPPAKKRNLKWTLCRCLTTVTLSVLFAWWSSFVNVWVGWVMVTKKHPRFNFHNYMFHKSHPDTLYSFWILLLFDGFLSTWIDWFQYRRGTNCQLIYSL
jgi:hypothetical protein